VLLGCWASKCLYSAAFQLIKEKCIIRPSHVIEAVVIYWRGLRIAKGVFFGGARNANVTVICDRSKTGMGTVAVLGETVDPANRYNVTYQIEIRTRAACPVNGTPPVLRCNFNHVPYWRFVACSGHGYCTPSGREFCICNVFW